MICTRISCRVGGLAFGIIRLIGGSEIIGVKRAGKSRTGPFELQHAAARLGRLGIDRDVGVLRQQHHVEPALGGGAGEVVDIAHRQYR
jgi:hypothetical protein